MNKNTDLLAGITFGNVGVDYAQTLARPSSFGVQSLGMNEKNESVIQSVRPMRATTAHVPESVHSAKPNDIQKLEQLLSAEYAVPVWITRVHDVSSTRKQVKEVYFHKGKKLSKIWVFKADPAATAKELITYDIVYRQGIPTGKPIGYIPTSASEQYPFDVAIVGGILEHAGDSYNALIENLCLMPNYVFDTALVIANMIAEYHVKLTSAQTEFKERGIVLERSSPRKELSDRLLTALHISEKKAGPVIDACELLAQKQSGVSVVSHGDIHTGNIVTKKDADGATSTDDFGVIDWGSIVLDNPYGDVRDFWAHHSRQAAKFCEQYQFTFEEVDRAYQTRVRQLLDEKQLGWLWQSKNAAQQDSLIQSALWNVYEMYDPVRKNPGDIREKARRHYELLHDDFELMKETGLRKEAVMLRRALSELLKTETYLYE